MSTFSQKVVMIGEYDVTEVEVKNEILFVKEFFVVPIVLIDLMTHYLKINPFLEKIIKEVKREKHLFQLHVHSPILDLDFMFEETASGYMNLFIKFNCLKQEDWFRKNIILLSENQYPEWIIDMILSRQYSIVPEKITQSCDYKIIKKLLSESSVKEKIGYFIPRLMNETEYYISILFFFKKSELKNFTL